MFARTPRNARKKKGFNRRMQKCNATEFALYRLSQDLSTEANETEELGTRLGFPLEAAEDAGGYGG